MSNWFGELTPQRPIRIPRNRNLRLVGVAHPTTDTPQEQEACTAGNPGCCDHLRGDLVRLRRNHHSGNQRRDDLGDPQCGSKLFRRRPDSLLLVLALGHRWQLPILVSDSGSRKVSWSGTMSYSVTGLTPGTTYSYQLCGEGDSISSFECIGSVNGNPSEFTTESSGSSSAPSTTTTTSTSTVQRPRPAPSRQRPRPAPVLQRPLSLRRHQLPSFRPTTQAPLTGTPPASVVASPTKCSLTTPESATLSSS